MKNLKHIKSINENNNANILIGAVIYKSVNYKITITKCNNAHLIPIEMREDFIDWLKSKAAELGLGNHCDYYYDLDETGDTWIEVVFNVSYA